MSPLRKNGKNGDEQRSEAIGKVSKRYSLFWLITALLVAMVVVPLVTFALRAINISKNYLEDTLIERQLKTAKSAASHIGTLVKTPEEKLKTLAASFEIYSSDTNVTDKYNDLIEHGILDLIASRDMPIAAFMDNRGNKLTAVYSKKTAFESESYPIISNADLAALEPYIWAAAREAMKTNGFYTSKVFLIPINIATDSGEGTAENDTNIERRQVPIKLYATVLRSNGEPVASLVSLAILSQITKALEDYGKEFILFVTDFDGKLLVQAEMGKGIKGKGESLQTEKGFALGEDLSSNPIVNWALRRSGSSGVFTAASASNKSVKTEDEGEITVTAAPVGDTGLLLFSYIPKKQFFVTISDLQHQSVVWVCGSIVVALLFGIFFTGKITKPLSILTEQSRKIANLAQQGKKIDEKSWEGTKAEVKTKNEVGELAEAFNLMVSQIQKYVQEVEAYAEENRQLFMSSIGAVVNAIDAKDPYTKGHSARVSAFSIAVAKEYGFDEGGLKIVRIASLLHDVGKIGIEDRILRKPGALTDEEFEIMKTHPSKGAEILGSIPQMREMIPGIKYHHERWSGGGYPSGLKGSEIPILARIVGIADAFDAMTTDRPYQKAMTFQMAANRIKELTPKVYDPLVTEAFLKAFHSGIFEKILRMAEGQKSPKSAV